MRRPFEEALRAFAEEVGPEGPVAVRGAGTRFELGGELEPGTRLLVAPSGVVELQPEEMTVRVRAGTAVEELHSLLAEAGQRTSLPERAGTVGGALMTGEDHLCVLGRGRLRDTALELRWVSAEGELVTGGGPTVKNVTGFDLPRLLVGSLGSLGLVAEATLRTNPIPTSSRWLGARDVDPFALRAELHRPSALLWDGTTTSLLLEGHPGDVEAELRRISSLGRFEELAGPPALPSRRWSLSPRALRTLDHALLGPFVASIGVGLVFAESDPPPVAPSPKIVELARRVKEAFDPSGRLSPGRSVWRRS